jgi:hypothetical protein
MKYLPIFRQVRDSYLADEDLPGEHHARDLRLARENNRDRSGGGTAGGIANKSCE